ncbi:MAG: hypothetical protein WCC64_11650 [Aliidongia sp.]
MKLRFLAPLAAAILAALAGCTKTGRPEPAADLGCAAEGAAFMTASQALPALPAASGEAYWNQLRQSGAETGATARRLTDELSALGSVIGRVDGGYAALSICRLGRADSLRAEIAAGNLAMSAGMVRLAAENKAFEAELVQGQAAATRIAALQSVLQETAERMIATAPDSSAKVARTVTSPAVPGTPYVAKENAAIFARPDPSGGRIADLRKGQRVQGPGGGPNPGWITLTLNDGSLGYVEVGVLRQVQPNASAVISPAQARALRNASSDPVVVLALTAREVVPAKSQGFASKLDAAAETASAAFAVPSGSAALLP